MRQLKKFMMTMCFATMLVPVGVSAFPYGGGLSDLIEQLQDTYMTYPPGTIDPNLSGGGDPEHGYILRLQAIRPLSLHVKDIVDPAVLEAKLMEGVFVETNYTADFTISVDFSSIKKPEVGTTEVFTVLYTVDDNGFFYTGDKAKVFERNIVIANYGPTITLKRPIPRHEAVMFNAKKLLTYVDVWDFDDGDLTDVTSVYPYTDSHTGKRMVAYSVSDSDGNYTRKVFETV